MIYEVINLNPEHEATLTCFRQPVGGEFGNIVKRPAMIVIPGGGYQFCSEREADPIVFPFLSAGYQVFILRYALQKKAVWPNPLRDYEDAARLIRSKADEWGIYPDKLAVVGFSAGGHLAASAATLSAPDCRPNAAILGYAVLSEESAHEWEKTAPGLPEMVDKNTCPCFLFASRNDSMVPVSNTIAFMTALEKAGISFESHIYAFAPHGASTGSSAVTPPDALNCSRVPHWVDDSIEWLKDMLGDFGDGKMTEPKCGHYVNADAAGGFSLDNTVGYLMSDPRSRAILAPIMEAAQKKANEQWGGGEDSGEDRPGSAVGMRITLREGLKFAGAPEEAVKQLEAALKAIES